MKKSTKSSITTETKGLSKSDGLIHASTTALLDEHQTLQKITNVSSETWIQPDNPTTTKSTRWERNTASVHKRPLTFYSETDETKHRSKSSSKNDTVSEEDKLCTGNYLLTVNETTSTQISLFSNFASWKASAGYVFESIRDKFNYFRRGKNTDVTLKIKSTQHQQPLNHVITKETPTDSSSVTSSSDVSRNTTKSLRSFVSQNKSSSDDTSTEKALTDNAEVCSLYDNDDISMQYEVNNSCPTLNKTVNLSPTSDLPFSAPLKLDKNINLVTDTNDNTKCSNTTLCSPCIGSKFHKETLANLKNNDGEPQSVISRPQGEPSSQILPKIVYDQPCNSQSHEQTHQVSASDNESLSTLEENSDSFSRPKLIDIPDVKLQSATPSCSVNQELNLQCGFLEEGNLSKESSEGNLDVVPSSDTSDYASIRDKRDSISYEIDNRRINDNEADRQYGINIWDLRNSLEQNTIEMQCPIAPFEDFEKSTDRRFSNATDGMTEASPLSTPSSEFNNFRGKSISDSEDDVRAYFVTPTGRISPRQPHFHQRATLSLSTSVDRTSTENFLKTDCSFVSASDFSSPRNLSEPSDFVTTTTPKNILVTQATIESPKSSHAVEESRRLRSLRKNVSEDSSINISSTSCEERRSKFFSSPKWSTVSDEIEILSDITDTKRPVAMVKSKKALYQLPRQTSLPLSTEHSIMHLPDCIEEQPRNQYHSEIKHEPLSSKKVSSYSCANQQHRICKATGVRGRFLQSSNSISSDEVFLSDSQSSLAQAGTNFWYSSINYRTTRCDPKQVFLNKTQNTTKTLYSPAETISPSFLAGSSLINSESKLAPPAPKPIQRPKHCNKLGSATSSGTSSPTSPSSSASEKPQLKSTKSVDMESDDSISSRTSSSRSSSSIRSLTKIFRRPNRNRQRSDSVPTFCGYSMERDYCVDSETDRIFKKFLSTANPNDSNPVLQTNEPLPPPSHMLPPPPLKNTSSTQLRRQVMRKQYSDTIAMYYGQRQRRWRFITKQKSDSVNCPIDRAIFRRQDRIDEEFDPEEINERLSSTSSRRESERQTEFVPPTVYELKEWRRSSEDKRSTLCHASSLPSYRDQKETGSNKPTRRVTFE